MLLMVVVALSCAFMGWAVVYLTARIQPRRTSFGSKPEGPERAGLDLPSKPRRTGTPSGS